VISDLSKLETLLSVYRLATKRLLDSRYSDGEVDAVAMFTFQCTIEEAEEAAKEDTE
jgi:hypothetical protein